MKEELKGEMMEILEEVNKLHAENESLRKVIKEGLEEGRTKTFLKGLGAGVAVTPLALWLAWKLIELAELAAEWIDVSPVLFGIVAVCVGIGLTLFFHSEALCHRANQALNLFLGSLDMGEED